MTGDEGQAHRETTRRAFALQAGTFESPSWVFRDTDVLDWIASHTPVSSGDRLLDAAGGTGATGRHLSRHAASCTVLDLVPEMLAAGVAASRHEGRGDVVYVQGDASAMPFPDGEFDVVLTRFALHHMVDPGAALREMVRVCRPGGRLTVVDVVVAPGPLGDSQNRLERLRDPSHSTALRLTELEDLLTAAGLDLDARSDYEGVMPADRWLDQSRTSPEAREEVESALHAEAAGGAATGLRATLRSDDRLTVTQTWALLGGVRAL